MSQKRLLNAIEAAEYLGVSVKTLELARSNAEWKRRQVFISPPFVRIGAKVWYLIEDLEAFIQARRVDPATLPAKPPRAYRRRAEHGQV